MLPPNPPTFSLLGNVKTKKKDPRNTFFLIKARNIYKLFLEKLSFVNPPVFWKIAPCRLSFSLQKLRGYIWFCISVCVCVCGKYHSYQLILLHSYDYLKKISIKSKRADWQRQWPKWKLTLNKRWKWSSCRKLSLTRSWNLGLIAESTVD